MVKTLSEPEIEALLMSATHAHLGCCADGKPYVVPVSFAFDGKRILGYTNEGKKIQMMRSNPEVCLQVEEITDLTNWKSAIVWGRFEELKDSQAAIAVGYLIDRYGPIFEEQPSTERRGREVTPPSVREEVELRVVYCIHVREMTGRAESE
ncbi:MAG TPA: pyridoxamine 5'-phosphate oxidase family protein [Fimbriimonadaceae bacterium]|nr:pyridoxamine 5'-phosphate oxidase family protein [Fimbriimonadaceae bacterium]